EKAEIDLWRTQDSLIAYGVYLKQNGHATDAQLQALHADIGERLVTVLQAAIALDLSPRVSMLVDSIGELMFSNQCADRLAERTPEVLLAKAESRLQTTLTKARFGLAETG